MFERTGPHVRGLDEPATCSVRRDHSSRLLRPHHRSAPPCPAAVLAACPALVAEPADEWLTTSRPVGSSSAVAGRHMVCWLSVLYSSGSVMRVYLKYLHQCYICLLTFLSCCVSSVHKAVVPLMI